jgi:hypothetical protein
MKRGLHKEEQEVPEGKARENEVRRGIGLVGPMSNYAASPQLVGNAPYGDLEEMHQFASK